MSPPNGSFGEQNQHQHPEPPEKLTGRRSFLRWCVHGLGGLFTIFLAIPIVSYIIDPRNRKASGSNFKDVAQLNDLPVGQPREFVIREQRRDAWTLYPNEVVGRVFLIREGEGVENPGPNDQPPVKAFTTICPHLGCSVNFTGDLSGNQAAFLCPCHGGRFSLDGNRIEPEHNPAPRAMDSLNVRYKPGNPSIVQVEYEKFYQNTPEKKERT